MLAWYSKVRLVRACVCECVLSCPDFVILKLDVFVYACVCIWMPWKYTFLNLWFEPDPGCCPQALRQDGQVSPGFHRVGQSQWRPRLKTPVPKGGAGRAGSQQHQVTWSLSCTSLHVSIHGYTQIWTFHCIRQWRTTTKMRLLLFIDAHCSQPYYDWLSPVLGEEALV